MRLSGAAQIENDAFQATQIQAFAFVLHVVCIECIASICNPWQHKLRMRQLSSRTFRYSSIDCLFAAAQFSIWIQ